MYKVQPYQTEEMPLSSLPTCMYQKKPYYSSKDQQQQSPELQQLIQRQEEQFRQLDGLNKTTSEIFRQLNLNDEIDLSADFLEDLSQQQKSQITRLNRLSSKLNDLCDELSLTSLKVATQSSSTKVPAQQTTKQQQANAISSSTTTTFTPVQPPTSQHQHQQQQQLTSTKSFKPLKPLVKKINVNMFADVKRVNTKINKDKSTVEDFSIFLSAKTGKKVADSALLFFLFNQMTLKYKCFVSFHMDGSVLRYSSDAEKTRMHNIINLFEQLGLTLSEPRNNYDYGFTFTWTHNVDEASLSLSQLNKPRVTGEESIVSHVSRLASFDVDKKECEASKLIKVLRSF